MPTVRPWSKCVLVLLALMALAIASASCGSESGSTSGADRGSTGASFYTGPIAGGKPRRGGVLKVTTPARFTSLDPEMIGASYLGAQANIFDQLVEIVPGTTKLQPG